MACSGETSIDTLPCCTRCLHTTYRVLVLFVGLFRSTWIHQHICQCKPQHCPSHVVQSIFKFVSLIGNGKQVRQSDLRRFGPALLRYLVRQSLYRTIHLIFHSAQLCPSLKVESPCCDLKNGHTTVEEEPPLKRNNLESVCPED